MHRCVRLHAHILCLLPSCTMVHGALARTCDRVHSLGSSTSIEGWLMQRECSWFSDIIKGLVGSMSFTVHEKMEKFIQIPMLLLLWVRHSGHRTSGCRSTCPASVAVLVGQRPSGEYNRVRVSASRALDG